MPYIPEVFPTLKDKTWAEVDLGEIAKHDYPAMNDKNELLNANTCEQWITKIAQKHGVDFTWGGHFENRKHLWRGYYNESEKVTHLGIDYNVPANTLVAAPMDCEVVHSWADCSHINGWGGRLILKLAQPWKEAPYLILGHLAHKDLPIVGTKFKKGEIITATGYPEENGGWFPHLHVQCVNEDYYNEHINNLELLDGYYLKQREPYDLAPSPKYLMGNDV